MRKNEVEHYRDTLLALRARLVEQVRGTGQRVVEETSARDELSHVPTHAADRESEGLDRDIAVAKSHEQMLDAIDRALARIDDGDYGRCEVCGQDITRDRLEALPLATRCITCEREREAG